LLKNRGVQNRLAAQVLHGTHLVKPIGLLPKSFMGHRFSNPCSSRKCTEGESPTSACREIKGFDGASRSKVAEQTSLKHIFFDFDQTISRCHVFKIIAGWEKGIPAPYALTDRGQISRIQALNAEGPCWTYKESAQRIFTSGKPNGELWTAAVLGGSSRIETLRSLFADLRAQGIVLTVITKGYVGAVKKILLEDGLLDNFDRVIGMIGQEYDKEGASEYDKLKHAPSELEGDANCALTVAKVSFIMASLKREGLTASQALLVEDDPNEIASVKKTDQRPEVCGSLFVSKRRGMMSAEMDELRRVAGYISAEDSKGRTRL